MLILCLLGPKGLTWASGISSIGCFLLALATFVWPLLADDHRTAAVSPAEIPEYLERLAGALGEQWEKEERLWRLNDPYPLPVRWEVTPTAVAAMLGGDRETASDAPAADLAGTFEEILPTYCQARRRRLVILGPVGAGKSLLAIRLAQDLLRARKPGEPVPVIVLPAGWDPEKGLPGLVADQLAASHPGLSRKVRSGIGEESRLADDLAKHAVLPILDGLDELPDVLRQKAFAEINADPRKPIIVTSRPKEFLDAVEAAGQTWSGGGWSGAPGAGGRWRSPSAPPW